MNAQQAESDPDEEAVLEPLPVSHPQSPSHQTYERGSSHRSSNPEVSSQQFSHGDVYNSTGQILQDYKEKQSY